MLKNRIIKILFILILAAPITSNAEIFSEPLINPAQEEAIIPIDNETEEETYEELPPVLDSNSSNYTFKQPVSKKKIAKKFLFAMLGVVISSVVLFILLSIYNKIRSVLIGEMSGNKSDAEENGTTVLQTPDTLTDAIKTFLDKTKWE